MTGWTCRWVGGGGEGVGHCFVTAVRFKGQLTLFLLCPHATDQPTCWVLTLDLPLDLPLDLTLHAARALPAPTPCAPPPLPLQAQYSQVRLRVLLSWAVPVLFAGVVFPAMVAVGGLSGGGLH